ncbi:MAG: PHP domain-containing protein [Chitinophagaceae bacterium]|jgi:DNA polymerase (family 10)|nr:PHP domain-containing protein [Chitinophagaceae bacterium]
MDNDAISENFSLLGKLMDIHGENSFKTKSYAAAARAIEGLPKQLSEMTAAEIFAVKGFGEAIGKKILEQLSTERLSLLDKYILETPPGVIEMLNIKGLGPKKIATIWHDLEIETIGELLYACNENRLLLYKGFGEKTQNNIRDAIEYYLSNIGNYLYAQVENYAHSLQNGLQQRFPNNHTQLTGDIVRHSEVITKLEFVTTVAPAALETYLNELAWKKQDADAAQLIFTTDIGLSAIFHLAENETLAAIGFETSCSDAFLAAFKNIVKYSGEQHYTSEQEIFSKNGMQFIPPFLRETENIIPKAKAYTLPQVIEVSDIKGIIHSHSTWSDGSNTIEEMLKAAVGKGFEYLVLSDHSQTAVYAKGLKPERVAAQHQEIDELNKKYAPFKIFKSIESDILNDGSLDYTQEVLSTFHLVIASVHSNLKMSEDKAMLRLLTAIENPFTSILGHLTGRLLLSRAGYPVNHKKIIDACAANNVVIELNAHPRRLDMDWRWIDYALEKNVLISIDPDAHTVKGFDDIRYGVLAAQKGGLPASRNLSSFNLNQMEDFIAKQQKKRLY